MRKSAYICNWNMIHVANTVMQKYPVGIQTFERIINEGYVYIDKTDLVWKLAHTAPYVFLSRPRRFGKSLLTTTLESYFKGDKELFEGLKIKELEHEWTRYPVLHIDLSTAKNQGNSENLRNALKDIIENNCIQYGVDMEANTPGQCLKKIITNAFEKETSQVVLLVDEYDAPLLDVLHESDRLEQMKEVMQEFYQPLKACERMIRFCFLTGITRFSQVSIFSTLNNIMNVSMHPDFAAICGITEGELTYTMREDVEELGHTLGFSFDEMHALLKKQYDGYHFSENSEDVYNPYSLMNCFAQKRVKNYWFESGTPSFLFNQMRRFGTDITKLDEIVAPESAFYRPTETLTDALPLLYQGGYLTIKDYSPLSQGYRLSIPNQEVRIGFAEGLLPIYSGLNSGDVQLGCAYKMWAALKDRDVDQSLKELKAFLAGVPYVEGFKTQLKEAATREGFYEYTLYLILSMLNVYVQTQVKCWTGRTDMIVYLADTIYLFEFKIKSTAKEAFAQIDDKHYADRFATDVRKVIKVGVNFDIESWNIESWLVE